VLFRLANPTAGLLARVIRLLTVSCCDRQHVYLRARRRLHVRHLQVVLVSFQLERAGALGRNRRAPVPVLLVVRLVVLRLLDLSRQIREPLVSPRRRLVVVRQAPLARGAVRASRVLRVRLALRQRNRLLSVGVLAPLLREEHHVRGSHRGVRKA
jgi:hypothetical protein